MTATPLLAFAALLSASLVAQVTPAPSPVPTGTVPAAAPSATPAYGFVYKPTPSPDVTPFPGPNPPTITEIDLSDSTLVTPGNIRVRVLTSDAVVSVAAETFGSSLPIAKVSNGTFALEGYVPAIPSAYKNRVYDVTFTATAADGRSARVVLPLVLK